MPLPKKAIQLKDQKGNQCLLFLVLNIALFLILISHFSAVYIYCFVRTCVNNCFLLSRSTDIVNFLIFNHFLLLFNTFFFLGCACISLPFFSFLLLSCSLYHCSPYISPSPFPTLSLHPQKLPIISSNTLFSPLSIPSYSYSLLILPLSIPNSFFSSPKLPIISSYSIPLTSI